MKTNTDLKRISDNGQTKKQSGKLLLSGFALFCCFVLTPLLGSLAYSTDIPFVFVYIFVVFCTNILPLIIIALSFRDIPPVQSISVVVLAAGVFRMIAEILISPVPFALVSTPTYFANIVLYTILLSVISAGVSLFNERKSLSTGIIVTGIILYLVFINKIFLTTIVLLSGG